MACLQREIEGIFQYHIISIEVRSACTPQHESFLFLSPLSLQKLTMWELFSGLVPFVPRGNRVDLLCFPTKSRYVSASTFSVPLSETKSGKRGQPRGVQRVQADFDGPNSRAVYSYI